jgi:hypothetical protein
MVGCPGGGGPAALGSLRDPRAPRTTWRLSIDRPLTVTRTPSGTITSSCPPMTVAKVEDDLAEDRGDREAGRDDPAPVPLLPGEDPGDGPAAVQPDRLGPGCGQVNGQLGEVAEGPGGVRPLGPAGMLLQRQPAVCRGRAEELEYRVPVGVGAAQVTGRGTGRSGGHTAEDTPCRGDSVQDRSGPARQFRGAC